MKRRFVIVTGLPGSGKTTLARRLAPLLGLEFLDKDDILERLFDTKGIGNEEWRAALSRESDTVFQQQVSASHGAVLVSFWRLPGTSPNSGTPTEWLRDLTDCLVNLHCACDINVAAARFTGRKRHPGHLDRTRTFEQLVARFRELESYGRIDVGPIVEVDTSGEPDVDAVARKVGSVLVKCNHEFGS